MAQDWRKLYYFHPLVGLLRENVFSQLTSCFSGSRSFSGATGKILYNATWAARRTAEAFIADQGMHKFMQGSTPQRRHNDHRLIYLR